MEDIPSVLHSRYKGSDKAWLERCIDKQVRYWLQPKDRMWAYQSTRGTDGIHYGHFRYIPLVELQSRTYEIRDVDGAIGIGWTDCLYNPRTRKFTHNLRDHARTRRPNGNIDYRL